MVPNFLRGLAVLLCYLIFCSPARALDTNASLASLHHDIWTAKDGAPGEITTMAQTRDGWIWLGTASGVYRFDGVRFEPLRLPPGEALTHRNISNVTAMADGDLLIGYMTGGLSRLSHGHIHHFPRQDDGTEIGPVFNVVSDIDGSVWAATGGTGLLRFRAGHWNKFGSKAGFSGVTAQYVFIDQYDVIWSADAAHLYYFDRINQRFVDSGMEGDVQGLIESPDGRLWFDDHVRLREVKSQKVGPTRPRPKGMNQITGQEWGLFDRDGNFWSLVCPVGICRTAQLGSSSASVLTPVSSPREKLDHALQVSSLAANILFEDQEGNIWVGTQAGLDRFRYNRFVTVDFDAAVRTFSMALDDKGELWALAQPSGALWRMPVHGTPLRQPAYSFVGDGVLATGIDGALLLGGSRVVERRYRGAVERIPLPDDVPGQPADQYLIRITEDGAGLWVDIGGRGGFRWVDHRWISAPKLGIPKGVLFAVAGRKGEMWFGYRDNVLRHFDNGNVKIYGADDGVDIGSVTFLSAAPDTLAAGDNGLALMVGKRFQRLRGYDPDALVGISGLAITKDGDHWFNGSKGVVHVAAAAWKAVLAHPERPLAYELLDGQDGYPGEAGVTMRLDTVVKDKEGQPWFIGTAGVARLDTQNLHRNILPPPVAIEALLTDERRYLPPDKLALPAGTSGFRIEYTALTYTSPARIRFRYQLEGFDKDWRDAANQRVAYYTNLGPGNYRFRVKAINEDGVWSDADAELAFTIMPYFVQTKWFFALCLLAVVALLYGAYVARLRYESRRIGARLQERLQARVLERERIARALHDTFLQSMHGLLLRFQTVLKRLPPGGEARALVDDILNDADDVIIEGRRQVLDLRSASDVARSLDASLGAVGETLESIHGTSFKMVVVGQSRAVATPLRGDIEQLAREALFNAFRHADAGHVELTLHYGDEKFELMVRDDGKGVTADVLDAGHVPGHWGLPGMRERAARIGGAFAIGTLKAGGTLVTLTVPAAVATPDIVRRHWVWRLAPWHWRP